jgi:cytoskeletal protein RodZ
MRSKIIKWIIIIGAGLAIGAFMAGRQTDREQLATVTDQTTAVQPSTTNTSEPAGVTVDVPANSTTDTTPVSVPPAAPVVAAVAELAPISYEPAANEVAAVATIKAFYQGYNLADEPTVVKQFDLSVSVTATVKTALAAGAPRPVRVIIKQIDTRSDDTQLATIQEFRSDSDLALIRELELFPTKNGVLITAYRASGNADVTSGFSK